MDRKNTFTSPQQLYKSARYVLLGLILLTVLNIALFLAGADVYFMSGLFTTYMMFIIMYKADIVLGVLLAVTFLVPFVFCFFLSKRKQAWMVVTLVMVCMDTLPLLVIALGSVALGRVSSLGYFVVDIFYHILAIVLLGMGVKTGKAAIGEQESDPYHPAEAIEQDIPPDDVEEPFTDAECTLSVSENGRRFGPSSNGVARFYETEVALGMKSILQEGIMGSRLTPTEEKLRFAYADIDRAFYRDVNEFNVQIDLVDGRACRFFLTRATRPQLVEALAAHGIGIEPYEY